MHGIWKMRLVKKYFHFPIGVFLSHSKMIYSFMKKNSALKWILITLLTWIMVILCNNLKNGAVTQVLEVSMKETFGLGIFVFRPILLVISTKVHLKSKFWKSKGCEFLSPKSIVLWKLEKIVHSFNHHFSTNFTKIADA